MLNTNITDITNNNNNINKVLNNDNTNTNTNKVLNNDNDNNNYNDNDNNNDNDNDNDNDSTNSINCKQDSCQELKNITYKTMLLNGNNISPIYEIKNQKEIINNFLESESSANKKEVWNKLDKTQKIIKLNLYAETFAKEKFNLTKDNVIELKKYFIKCLDRKNLLKAKEVIYNKENGTIINIPFLFYSTETSTFILKKDDKHISTIKSLAPDKKNSKKTLKNNTIENN